MAVHWFLRIAAFSFLWSFNVAASSSVFLTWKLWNFWLLFKAICLQRTPKKKMLNHSSSLITLPSSKLTWQWKMDLLKMYSLLKMGIFAMLAYWSVSVYAHLCSSHSSHLFFVLPFRMERWQQVKQDPNARALGSNAKGGQRKRCNASIQSPGSISNAARHAWRVISSGLQRRTWRSLPDCTNRWALVPAKGFP